ncbi:hypothetical protein C0J52_04279 [Blattella germanica]|nr:hypothetical protein C0J52_04279 [Blattella germanica]
MVKKSPQEKSHPVHYQSTPLHRNSDTLVLSNISPIFKDDVGCNSNEDTRVAEASSDTTLTQVSMKDLSTWVLDRVKGEAAAAHPSGLSTWMADSYRSQKLEELDTILEKLQHVLGSNFSLEGKEEACDKGGG